MIFSNTQENLQKYSFFSNRIENYGHWNKIQKKRTCANNFAGWCVFSMPTRGRVSDDLSRPTHDVKPERRDMAQPDMGCAIFFVKITKMRHFRKGLG